MHLVVRSALVALVCLASVAFAADEAPVIFSDNFSTLEPGWGDDVELSVSDNKLLVDLKPGAIYADLYDGKRFDLSSADMRLTVARSAGSSVSAGGLVFWAIDYNNYYAALVRSNGEFDIVRKSFGQWLVPVSLSPRDELKKEIGRPIELRVVTSGPMVTAYINGKQVTSFRGFPPSGESRIGIHAEPGGEPGRWAFSALSVRQGPAPATPSSLDESILFADNFASLDPSWSQTSAQVSVGGNKLILRPLAHGAVSFAYDGRLFEDADIRLKISEIAGGTTSAGGLRFWGADEKNFYAAFLRADGNCWVAQFADGKWQNLFPMKQRKSVLQGLGQANELRVVTIADTATIYVNERQITRLEGQKHPEHSRIGLQVESDEMVNTWTISDFVVRKPQ